MQARKSIGKHIGLALDIKKLESLRSNMTNSSLKNKQKEFLKPVNEFHLINLSTI